MSHTLRIRFSVRYSAFPLSSCNFIRATLCTPFCYAAFLMLWIFKLFGTFHISSLCFSVGFSPEKGYNLMNSWHCLLSRSQRVNSTVFSTISPKISFPSGLVRITMTLSEYIWIFFRRNFQDTNRFQRCFCLICLDIKLCLWIFCCYLDWIVKDKDAIW